MAPILTTFTLSLLFLSHISAYILTQPTGFTVDLIHREHSPLSPFYNPSLTKFDRLHNTIYRSKLSSSSPNTIGSQLTYFFLQDYLMQLSIGTPPFTVLGVADTGSDLIWTQCYPCTNCFNQTSPFFNPKNSSTYNNIPCNNHKTCEAIDSSLTCGSATNFCQYVGYAYGDHSFTNGDLAVDSFTFGSTSQHPISVPNIKFGCGRNNSLKYFVNTSVSGIIGLGGGNLSLINQLKYLIHGKFSYCLVSIHDQPKTSKISLGRNAVVKGNDVVSTTMITRDDHFYLNLEKITVGGYSIEFKAKVEGNIVIDSGTTLTYIPSRKYRHLELKVKELVGEKPASEGADGLCYQKFEGRDRNYPKVTFHFTGADVDLPSEITFIEMSKDLECFTIRPTNDDAIFGNMSQMNLLVGYDLVKGEVSFKPTDCTKQ
ncbi:hypothetical protein LguiB_006645 [Lonicera macranthoides]